MGIFFDTYIIAPFTNLLLLIYGWVGNDFGWAIIVFTILTRLALFPLTNSQVKSTKAMQDMQQSPEWQKIQKKYKGDREKLAQEQMRLYQEMGVNPLGSCLPTLIQLPLIIGLYRAIIGALSVTPLQLFDLSKTISLGNAAELLPLTSNFLWISDLSQPERVSFVIPILTIIVVITSYLQTKLMTPPSSTPGNEQAAAMTSSMTFMMPLMLGFFSYTYSAGLALYFVTSNVATIAQYALLGRLDWRNLIPGMAKKA
ncbi:MAG: membrane protein insertase YidC [Chloroflexi bacterium]|nr:MAG: membrane protein insertase YidC [Chloroflexota bacterium]MBL1195320.1 membrane protein insertase YidC [Chloroflexota bacterium]NOH12604.1 membrane protein insertase YidC [Chloroflexota bacterium]